MGNEEYHQLEREINSLIEAKHQHLILDCSALTFITSVNLDRIFKSSQQLRERGGQIRIVGLSLMAQRMAQRIGFKGNAELLPDLNLAIKSIAQ